MIYPNNPKDLRRTNWKAALLNYDAIMGADLTPHCLQLDQRQIMAILALIEPLRWKTRWFGDTEPDEAILGEFVETLYAELATQKECFDIEQGDCVEYPPFASNFVWFPETPYKNYGIDLLNMPPWFVIGRTISGWLSDVLTAITNFLGLGDLIEQLIGLVNGDVITTVANLETAFGFGGDWNAIQAPGFQFHWNGAATVELHLLEVFAGGYAFVTVDEDPFGAGSIGGLLEFIDAIIDETDTLIDLERDVATLPYFFEVGDAERIIEETVTTPGDHYIAVRFLPKIEADLTPIGFGGGIRKVVLCGQDIGGDMYDLRVSPDCVLEYSKDGGVTWFPVPGSDNLLACAAAELPVPVEDIRITANEEIEFDKGGSSTQLSPRLVTNESATETKVNSSGVLLHPGDAPPLQYLAQIGDQFQGARIGSEIHKLYGLWRAIAAPNLGNFMGIQFAKEPAENTMWLMAGAVAQIAQDDPSTQTNTAGRLLLQAGSGGGLQTGITIEGQPASGLPAKLSFYNKSPAIVQPIVTGNFDSAGGAGSFLSAIADLGLINLASPTFSARALASDIIDKSTIVTDVLLDEACNLVVYRNGIIFRTIDMSDCILSAVKWTLPYDFSTESELDDWDILTGIWRDNSEGRPYNGLYQDITDFITYWRGETYISLQFNDEYYVTTVDVSLFTAPSALEPPNYNELTIALYDGFGNFIEDITVDYINPFDATWITGLQANNVGRIDIYWDSEWDDVGGIDPVNIIRAVTIKGRFDKPTVVPPS